MLCESGIRRDLSNKDYHGLANTYSSSQMKDLLDDPEYFYRKHVLKTVERLETPAFDIGTYFHTAILEPEKLALECAVYAGIRRGKDWETFKTNHQGKAIITQSELDQANMVISAVKNSPVAMSLIQKGEPEVSAILRLKVLEDGEIYNPLKQELLLKTGWAHCGKVVLKGAVDLVIKARSDLLGTNYILDLKSTTGNAKSQSLMRRRVSDYSYDLSAALYLDVFNALAQTTIYEGFYWVFSSKDMGNSKTYVATSENILVGRAKWKKAVQILANCIRKNWLFTDELGYLEPQMFELEHIRERLEDFL